MLGRSRCPRQGAVYIVWEVRVIVADC